MSPVQALTGSTQHSSPLTSTSLQSKLFPTSDLKCQESLHPLAGHVQTVSWDSHPAGEPRVKNKVEYIGIGGKSWSLIFLEHLSIATCPTERPMKHLLLSMLGWISDWCRNQEWHFLSLPCCPNHFVEHPRACSFHPGSQTSLSLRSPPSHPPTQTHAPPLPSLHAHFVLQFPFIFCLCSVSALSSPPLELFDSWCSQSREGAFFSYPLIKRYTKVPLICFPPFLT